MSTCPRCYLFIGSVDRFCAACGATLLEDDFSPVLYADPPPYVPAADRPGPEPVLVYCCRCPMDEAFWNSTADEVETTVSLHVWTRHSDVPGPRLPDGRPEWVEGEDWWLCTEDDVHALNAVRALP